MPLCWACDDCEVSAAGIWCHLKARLIWQYCDDNIEVVLVAHAGQDENAGAACSTRGRIAYSTSANCMKAPCMVSNVPIRNKDETNFHQQYRHPGRNDEAVRHCDRRGYAPSRGDPRISSTRTRSNHEQQLRLRMPSAQVFLSKSCRIFCGPRIKSHYRRVGSLRQGGRLTDSCDCASTRDLFRDGPGTGGQPVSRMKPMVRW